MCYTIYYTITVICLCTYPIRTRSLASLRSFLSLCIGVPGGKDERFTKYRPDILSCIWLYDGDKEAQCSGDIVHDICIINSGDLHRIRRRLMYNPEANHQTFFFNKYFIERDRVVIDCVEQELLRRNREEHHTDTHTN